MNHYETLFILKPTLTEEEINNNLEKIKESLTSQGANILAVDNIGLRRLAYPVKKNERGIYYVLYYTADGSIIAEFERKLRFNEDVLKFLTIKYRTKKEILKFEMFVSKINGTIEIKEEKKEEPQVEEKEEEKKPEETATEQPMA
jgi:small subunit ribosomal protein S6